MSFAEEELNMDSGTNFLWLSHMEAFRQEHEDCDLGFKKEKERKRRSEHEALLRREFGW